MVMTQHSRCTIFINIQCFNLDTRYHIRIALFQFSSHLPTLSMLPSKLLNPNRASLQAGRESTTLTTLNSAKSFKNLTVLQRKDCMWGIMLWKFPAPLQRITWQWRLNQRTSKSGAVRADGETPDASTSGHSVCCLKTTAFELLWNNTCWSRWMKVETCSFVHGIIVTLQECITSFEAQSSSSQDSTTREEWLGASLVSEKLCVKSRRLLCRLPISTLIDLAHLRTRISELHSMAEFKSLIQLSAKQNIENQSVLSNQSINLFSLLPIWLRKVVANFQREASVVLSTVSCRSMCFSCALASIACLASNW
jgi:hypothetical protein